MTKFLHEKKKGDAVVAVIVAVAAIALGILLIVGIDPN